MLEVVLLEARNPGPMTGAGNNTYLIVDGGEAVLIDAGVGHPDHLAAIGRALSDRHAALRMVLLTHGHADHASGAPAIAGAYPGAVFAKFPWPGGEPALPVTWQPLRNGEHIPIGETAITAVHTPGHSPDHLAFWHAGRRALFTGDLVIAGGTVMIEASRGGNLTQYLHSLERALELGPERLLPSHGPAVEDPPLLVRSYLEHRRARECQVVAAIRTGRRTVEQIAESIYDGLDPRLMPAARETVRAHLEKLAAEGIAVDRGGWHML